MSFQSDLHGLYVETQYRTKEPDDKKCIRTLIVGLTRDEACEWITFGEEVRFEASSNSLGPRDKIDIVVGSRSSRLDDAGLQINVEKDTVSGITDVSDSVARFTSASILSRSPSHSSTAKLHTLQRTICTCSNLPRKYNLVNLLDKLDNFAFRNNKEAETSVCEFVSRHTNVTVQKKVGAFNKGIWHTDDGT